jgi:hypothetical protein
MGPQTIRRAAGGSDSGGARAAVFTWWEDAKAFARARWPARRNGAARLCVRLRRRLPSAAPCTKRTSEAYQWSGKGGRHRVE